MKPIAILAVLIALFPAAKAQSFAVNTDGSAANNSAILDVKSTLKGMLIPRMSKTERKTIPAPANGLLVYQNAPDSTGFYFFDGSVWNWLSNPNPTNAWNINGNTGTDVNTNFIGTNDFTDLAFKIGGFERMRLVKESELGIGNTAPKYTLDISYGQAGVSTCTKNGIRIKSAGLFANDCEKGFLVGYNDPLSTTEDAVLWNYGQGGSGIKNILFGMSLFEVMRLNSNGFLGLGQTAPLYTLDINAGIAAVNPCGRNGIRINSPSGASTCDNGLFFGFDNMSSTKSTSIWNFENPFVPSPDLYFRFGFGDQTAFIGGEVMRILPPGKGIGIGTTTPVGMVHIVNNTGGGAMPGVMSSSSLLPANAYGFYTGLRISPNPNDGYVWNYQNAPTLFGTNDLERMRITADGDIGIGVNTPLEKLHVLGNIRASGLSGTDNRLLQTDANGTISSYANGTDGQILTIVSGAASWQNNTAWQPSGNAGTVPSTDFVGTTDAVDLAFRTNNIESMRLLTNGNLGIGVATPGKKMEVVGAASATPVTLVIGNRGGFGPAAMEFVSDYGAGNQWRPGFIRSNDIGTYTGAVEIFTNGTGAGNLYGNVKGLEVRNGVTYTATGTVSSFSDVRLKKNILAFTDGLDVINQINPVSFNYNELAPFTTDKTQIGIVAQDLEKIAPYMVDKTSTKEMEDMRSVNNQAYIFLLINAVKEENKKIQALEKQVEEQRKMIQALKK